MVGDVLWHRKDAIEFMQATPAGSVDLMITDPPYESLEKHRAVGTTTRLKKSKASSNEWFDVFPNERFPAFFEAAYRVLARHAHLYLFCDAETMFAVKPMGEAAGFTFRKPLVWDKVAIGMGYSYRARYEFVLFFSKTRKQPLRNRGMADIIAEKRVFRGMPTEKPVNLIRKFVTQSSDPGQIVMDPFAGSGAVAKAAVLEGRRCLANDLYVEMPNVLLTPENGVWLAAP